MAKEKKTKQKAKIVRWRGVLADSNRILRWMIALVLMVTSIVFTFTQLGFVGFELPDGTVTDPKGAIEWLKARQGSGDGDEERTETEA